MTTTPKSIVNSRLNDRFNQSVRVVDRREEFSNLWTKLFPSGKRDLESARKQRVQLVSLFMEC